MIITRLLCLYETEEAQPTTSWLASAADEEQRVKAVRETPR